MIKKCLVILILLSGAVLAQEAKKADVWEPLRFFAGDWEGAGTGPSGSSKIFTKFEFVLGGKYLVFEPQEKNPEGEIHEDLGLVSYDGARQIFVFRQFHIEGYVNQYVLDSLSPDGKMLVFVSESLENAPPAIRPGHAGQRVHVFFGESAPAEEIKAVTQMSGGPLRKDFV